MHATGTGRAQGGGRPVHDAACGADRVCEDRGRGVIPRSASGRVAAILCARCCLGAWMQDQWRLEAMEENGMKGGFRRRKGMDGRREGGPIHFSSINRLPDARSTVKHDSL